MVQGRRSGDPAAGDEAPGRLQSLLGLGAPDQGGQQNAKDQRSHCRGLSYITAIYLAIGAGEQGTIFSEVIIKVIEEFSEGFLILNERREIIFFNEVLLRLTGWRSKDILAGEEFLRHLEVEKCRGSERLITIPDPQGLPCQFLAAAFDVEADSRTYTLVRLRQELGAQAAASASEPFERLSQNIGDPLLSANLKGRVLAANPAFYQLLGYPPEEPIKDIAALYVYKEELEDKLLRLLEHDSVFNLDTHLYDREKVIKRVLDSSWVMRDSRGVVTGYTSLLKDVSYLRNLEARLMISERNYALLFDTILSSIIIVDPLGKILNWNYTAEQLYGYSWEEVNGADFDALFRTSSQRPTLLSIFELADQNQGRFIEAEVPRQRKDGSTIYTYASYSSIQNTSGETIAYSVIEKDLTERVNLERKLKDSFDQLKETQSATILGFARLTEYRDKDTGKHLRHIREYVKVLAKSLKGRPHYTEYITDLYLEDLCLSSVLHDVGKVAIEDSILLKPASLTTEEFSRIKDHARMGGDALRDVDRELRQRSFLTLGKEIAYYHHERWDGKGYPEGRKGEQIPLSARIVALADVYDALTSDRPYRRAMPHAEAVEVIREGRGSQFDPDITDAFLSNEEVFDRIRKFHEFEEQPEGIDQLLADSVKTLTEASEGA
jgi:PAS domain S-box-containing protein